MSPRLLASGLRRLVLAAARHSMLRRSIVSGADTVIAAASLWTAFLLRFDGEVPAAVWSDFPSFMALLVACRLVANSSLRLHRWSFRHSGLPDGLRIAIAGVLGTGLFVVSLFLLSSLQIPRSVVVLELLMSTLFMAGLRFSPRLAGIYHADWSRARTTGTVRTLIVGAGGAGEMLLRDLVRSGDHNYNVVGFVDDDHSKHGVVVGGRMVLGRIEDLPRLARALRVQQVLIAITRLEGRRIREILSICSDSQVRFKILPMSYAYVRDHAPKAALQELEADDLLMRAPVAFGDNGAGAFDANRVVLVTGAAGSIGSEICRQLLAAGLKHLVMTDLNENGLYMQAKRFAREFPEAAVRLEVADIRDEVRIRSLFGSYRPSDVFHAAAHKHVPLMEAAPCEAIKNNVLGTRHVARAAHDFQADRMLYISTDKAVRPTSVMGASKRVGEQIVRHMARHSGTRFCAVRFGNVLGSAGSVVPIFKEQIDAGGPVTVTHPDMRRYFMTIPEAVMLVLQAAYRDYGDLCVLDMGEQIRIVDLARQLITMSGRVPELEVPIVFTGLRPGEKLYEELMTEEEDSIHQVHQKILVASSPPPPEDLDARIDELRAAAAAEQPLRVVDLLQALVPSYNTPIETPGTEGPRDAPRATFQPRTMEPVWAGGRVRPCKAKFMKALPTSHA